MPWGWGGQCEGEQLHAWRDYAVCVLVAVVYTLGYVDAKRAQPIRSHAAVAGLPGNPWSQEAAATETWRRQYRYTFAVVGGGPKTNQTESDSTYRAHHGTYYVCYGGRRL